MGQYTCIFLWGSTHVLRICPVVFFCLILTLTHVYSPAKGNVGPDRTHDPVPAHNTLFHQNMDVDTKTSSRPSRLHFDPECVYSPKSIFTTHPYSLLDSRRPVQTLYLHTSPTPCSVRSSLVIQVPRVSTPANVSAVANTWLSKMGHIKTKMGNIRL